MKSFTFIDKICKKFKRVLLKIDVKKIKKPALIIVLSIFILGAVLFSGIQIGKKYYPSINLIKGATNLETGKPADVDFSLFWDTWRILQADYLNADSLDKQKMLYGAITGMVSALDDPYTTFFTPEEAKTFNEDVSGSFVGIGVELGLRNGILTVISPLEDTPAWQAGLKAGDQIIKIGDTPTSDISVDEAVDLIRGEAGTQLTLTIMRKSFDATKEFIVTRNTIAVPSTKLEFLDNDIAYVKLLNFNENAAYNFYRTALEVIMKKSPAMILDLRNNPGGYLEVSVNIAGWFLKQGQTVVKEDMKNGEESSYTANGNEVFSTMPIIILTNEGTASASEILAGALRDNRGIKIVGEKSYGKGSVQEIQQLADNSMVKITIAEWLTPNGISINKNGLEPDYEVELTDEDYENDKDPQLDKALELITKQITIDITPSMTVEVKTQ